MPKHSIPPTTKSKKKVFLAASYLKENSVHAAHHTLFERYSYSEDGVLMESFPFHIAAGFNSLASFIAWKQQHSKEKPALNIFFKESKCDWVWGLQHDATGHL